MKRPSLFELQAIAAVGVHRNFRAAAAELGLSPSALSHAVAALEQRLGVRLVNRTTRSVSLSEAGETFLARIRPALAQIADAMEGVNAFRDSPAGTLRINASERAARLILQPVVLAFMRRHPGMKVELASEGRMLDIVAEGFDAGIRLAEFVPLDMIAVPCGPRQRFVVVASPAYLESMPTPRAPGDILAHRCIRWRFKSGALYRWEFEKRGEEILIDAPGALTLDNEDLIIRAAYDGAGLAYMSEWSAAADIKAGRLVRVLEDWTPSFPGFQLYYPANRHPPAGLQAFIAVLRDANRSERFAAA